MTLGGRGAPPRPQKICFRNVLMGSPHSSEEQRYE